MAWLGLTLECAHCHDHKFDPITQKDHYRFFAFFNNVPELGEDGRVANAVPMIPAPTADQQRRARVLEAAIARHWSRKVDRRRQSAKVNLEVLGRGAVAATARTARACIWPANRRQSSRRSLPTAWRARRASRAMRARSRRPAERRSRCGEAGPITFSAWVRPDARRPVPLLSTMDYATNPASTGYGKGIELRLEGGELEFRWADRFPAYSVRGSVGGRGDPAAASGHISRSYMRASAAKTTLRRAGIVGADVRGWARSADARLNDGLSLPDAKSKPTRPRFRIGWDHRRRARYQRARWMR